MRTPVLLLVLASAVLLGSPGIAEAPRPNVLLISIDTLRADAVGERKGTPALVAFLKQATRFAGARTPVPLTLPAHASLLTGLLPARHGIQDNASPGLARGRTFTLLAEEFLAAGYDTAAFVSAAVLDPRTGIGEGFRSYDLQPASAPEFQDYGETPAEVQATRVLHWLQQRRARRPSFLFVHFFDPHDPYLPYAGSDGRPGTTASDREAARYAGEVSRVDEALERILAAVPASTLVVIASDHGESLGEHGERTHGMLCFSATSNVFLAARGPRLPPGVVVEGARSLCDVAPTLRAWCGLAEKSHDGAPLFDPPKEAVVTESLYAWRTHGWGQCFSVFDGSTTLVEGGRNVRLFDTASDPAERNALDVAQYAAYERLDRALTALRQSPRDAPSPAATLQIDTPYGTARRPDLRYLTRPENARLPDPADRIAFCESLRFIQRGSAEAYHVKDTAALLAYAEQLKTLAESEPTNPAPRFEIARLSARLAALTQSREWHRSSSAATRMAMERGYWDPMLLFGAFEQALRSEDLGEIRAVLDLALDLRSRPEVACLRVARDAARRLAGAGDRTALELYRTLFERVRRETRSEEEREAMRELDPS
ncbi:MAG: sulfatase [Planctomycetaceae bacterium]